MSAPLLQRPFSRTLRLGRWCSLLAIALILVLAQPPAWLGYGNALAKGIAPTDAACDGVDKTSPAWTACFSKMASDLNDAELFYAGYWLARSGSYAEALTFLNQVREPTAASLTYTGFAIRKLGDAPKSLDYYDRALALEPDYVVARSYRGEAYLALGEPDKAKAELAEIAARCGTACAEFQELAAAIGKQG